VSIEIMSSIAVCASPSWPDDLRETPCLVTNLPPARETLERAPKRLRASEKIASALGQPALGVRDPIPGPFTLGAAARQAGCAQTGKWSTQRVPTTRHHQQTTPKRQNTVCCYTMAHPCWQSLPICDRKTLMHEHTPSSSVLRCHISPLQCIFAPPKLSLLTIHLHATQK
jgi:hypothetical protein